MREIKLRAWDKLEKKMKEIKSIEFLGLNKKENKNAYLIGFHNSFPKGYKIPIWYKSPQYILENTCYKIIEFTGLHDKNGKEIFEGDIVKGKYGGSGHKVVFHKGCFMLHLYNDDRFLDFYSLELHNFMNLDIEIIGNIYENPELLK